MEPLANYSSVPDEGTGTYTVPKHFVLSTLSDANKGIFLMQPNYTLRVHDSEEFALVQVPFGLHHSLMTFTDSRCSQINLITASPGLSTTALAPLQVTHTGLTLTHSPSRLPKAGYSQADNAFSRHFNGSSHRTLQAIQSLSSPRIRESFTSPRGKPVT